MSPDVSTLTARAANHNGRAKPKSLRVYQHCSGPVIDAGSHDIPRISAEAWEAIRAANDPPHLFRFGSRPARIETDGDDMPIIRAVEHDRLRHVLARAARWTKTKGSGKAEMKVAAAPPKDIVADMLAAPEFPLPILSRIVQAPIVAADGSICTDRGYHLASRTYYAPAAGFGVPHVSDSPTPSEIVEARCLLLDELLGDFPFTGDSERAHALAAILLPFAREMFDGSTPLHLIEKPTPGTGATLLVDMLTYAATGRPVATMTEGRDEDEWRKRITAKLRSGAGVVLIDNLRRRLDSAAVAAAITSPMWEDRALGASEMVTVPVRCIWLATGNNPAVSDEISRRTVRIRLDARVDQPWRRTAFRHADLRGWAREHRGKLVWAALTLCRAWAAAGRPDGDKVLGMLEGWSRTIGGILAVAGVDGFLVNLDEFYAEADSEGAAWRSMLAAWWERWRDAEVGTAEIFAELSDSLVEMLGDGGEQSRRIRLGKMLAAARERRYTITTTAGEAKLRLVRGQQHRRAYQWRLVGDV